MTPAHARPSRSAVRGCLLAGALGDALGAPVEFDSLDRITDLYGPLGPDALSRAYGTDGAVTDDTQMALFTAEGLLDAHASGTPPLDALHRAYLRWLHTQDASTPPEGATGLSADPALYACRAPGLTCLSALRSGRAGTVDEPLNDSKGCGGVMRVAPVGLLLPPEEAFVLGRDAAALTHGHVDGILPAAVLAMTVSLAARGAALPDALAAARDRLVREPHHAGTKSAIDAAVRTAASGPPSPDALEALGGGWTGEEALAIALACALAHPTDLRAALRAAVTHSGDSDSTGTLCGHLLGATLGEAALPHDWLATLELRPTIERLADALWSATA